MCALRVFFSAPSLLWFCRLFVRTHHLHCAVNCQCLFYFVFSVCARELFLSIFISVPIYKTIICICHTEPVCILYNARSISGDLNYRNYLNARHICVVVVVQIIEYCSIADPDEKKRAHKQWCVCVFFYF